MEISKELPANLYISHFKARIYYEGLKNRCFYCKSEEHQKANCPKLASVKAAHGGTLYSDVLSNSGAGPSSRTTSDSLNTSTIPAPIRMVNAPAGNVEEETAQPVGDGNSASNDNEMRVDEDGAVEDPKNPLKRPTVSTSGNDSSESEELGAKDKVGKPKKKQQHMVLSETASPIDSIGARVGSKNRSRSATGSQP